MKGIDRFGVAPQPLAPDDHLVESVAQRLCDSRRLLLEGTVGVEAVGAERSGQGAEERGRVSRRVADGLLSAAVERRGVLGGDHQLRSAAPDGLADSQVEDRHLVQRIDPHHQDRVGVIEVRHSRAVVGPGQLPEERGVDRVGRAVDVGRARAANNSLDQPALLVGGPAADEGGGALTRVSESVG
jgi:hypothetical protein